MASCQLYHLQHNAFVVNKVNFEHQHCNSLTISYLFYSMKYVLFIHRTINRTAIYNHYITLHIIITQWNINIPLNHTTFTICCLPVHRTRARLSCCVCFVCIFVYTPRHTTPTTNAVSVEAHKQYKCCEQIGKRGISFSGSQYGSCSTIYNTLPVTKVVYNWFRAPASQ